MLQEIMSEGNENHYQDNRVAGRDSDEVGTRDGLWTNQLKLGLDGVQHRETSDGSVVGYCKLLRNEA
jgi:hypothetical protein